MIPRLVLVVFFLIGCSHTFKEPYRAKFFTFCEKFGIPAVSCECIEHETVSITGITNVTTKEDEDKLASSVPGEVIENCLKNQQ